MVIGDYMQLALLIGGVLAFLLSAYFLIYPNQTFSNRILGTLIFFWTIIIWIFALQSYEFYTKFPHLYGSPSSLTLLFFPLMFIYISTYFKKDARSFGKYLYHFIPFVLFWIAFSPFFFQSAEIKSAIIGTKIPDRLLTLLAVTDVVIIFQGLFYTMASMAILQKIQVNLQKVDNKEKQPAIKLLKNFLLINILLWAIGSVGALVEMFEVSVPIDLFRVYYGGLTLLTLWLGYFALKMPHIFSMGDRDRKESSIVDTVLKKEIVDTERLTNNKDIETIISFMEKEKPYLKNDMVFYDLVKNTGLSRRKISELLNNELKLSFPDFVNEYRTREAVQLLVDGVYKQHTLTHLAELAGFNSKATFNRIFKKNTGKTPTEYIQLLNCEELIDDTKPRKPKLKVVS